MAATAASSRTPTAIAASSRAPTASGPSSSVRKEGAWVHLPYVSPLRSSLDLPGQPATVRGRRKTLSEGLPGTVLEGQGSPTSLQQASQMTLSEANGGDGSLVTISLGPDGSPSSSAAMGQSRQGTAFSGVMLSAAGGRSRASSFSRSPLFQPESTQLQQQGSHATKMRRSSPELRIIREGTGHEERDDREEDEEGEEPIRSSPRFPSVRPLTSLAPSKLKQQD